MRVKCSETFQPLTLHASQIAAKLRQIVQAFLIHAAAYITPRKRQGRKFFPWNPGLKSLRRHEIEFGAFAKQQVHKTQRDWVLRDKYDEVLRLPRKFLQTLLMPRLKTGRFWNNNGLLN